MLGAGFFVGRHSIENGEIETSSDKVRLRPGPWGDVEYVPITIAAPDEMLKVRGVEDSKVEWLFKGATRGDLDRALDLAGVSASARAAFLSSGPMSQYVEGTVFNPSCAAIRALSEKARTALFQKLAVGTQNTGSRWEFQSRFIEAFGDFGVSRKSAKTVEAYGVRDGKFFLTYCMPCILRDIGDPAEKTGILKALTQQRSMLVRLRVGPNTDVNALVNYWGRAMWTNNVRAILQSLQKRPGGGVVDLAELLPPLPTSLLHSYPVPHNALAGPEAAKNCSWTAFNFFRDPPDPGFTDAHYVLGKLETDYYPIESDPRFGDVAVFLSPDQLMVHVATYLADDVYFTKNGDNPWHPWVYSTSKDLLEEFSFGLPEGKSLSIQYFRNKYY